MINSICSIQTPFPEKFGLPRQSLLIEETWGKMVFPKNSFNGLVKPPRFESKMKWEVYATRSPHHLNDLGLL